MIQKYHDKVYKHTYYKGENLISGLPLPTTHIDGYDCIIDAVFINCDFHPAVTNTIDYFKNCVFVGCDGMYHLEDVSFSFCTFHNCYGIRDGKALESP